MPAFIKWGMQTPCRPKLITAQALGFLKHFCEALEIYWGPYPGLPQTTLAPHIYPFLGHQSNIKFKASSLTVLPTAIAIYE